MLRGVMVDRKIKVSDMNLCSTDAQTRTPLNNSS